LTVRTVPVVAGIEAGTVDFAGITVMIAHIVKITSSTYKPKI